MLIGIYIALIISRTFADYDSITVDSMKLELTSMFDDKGVCSYFLKADLVSDIKSIAVDWKVCHERLISTSKRLTVMSYAHPIFEIRSEASRCLLLLKNYTIAIFTNQKFYEKLLEGPNQPENPISNYLLRQFELQGNLLSPDKRIVLVNINHALDEKIALLSDCIKESPETCHLKYEKFDHILRLRNMKSQALGFKSHASFRFYQDSRLAISPENVHQFLQGNLLSDSPPDLSSYNQVNEAYSLREISASALGLIANFLNLRISPLSNASVWHQSVFVFEVVDNDFDDGTKVRCNIYMDLFKRTGKMNSGATYLLDVPSSLYDSASVVIMTSFEDTIVDFKKVKSLFHELGHAFQICLGRSEYVGLLGYPLDFAEMVSQFFELWTYYLFLDKSIAVHAIHQELSRKNSEQLVLALFDIEAHSSPFRIESLNLYSRLCAKYKVHFSPESDWHFSHLLRGYDAGYYSYYWSKKHYVDFIYKKRNEIINNLEFGKCFKKCILWEGDLRKVHESIVCLEQC